VETTSRQRQAGGDSSVAVADGAWAGPGRGVRSPSSRRKLVGAPKAPGDGAHDPIRRARTWPRDRVWRQRLLPSADAAVDIAVGLDDDGRADVTVVVDGGCEARDVAGMSDPPVVVHEPDAVRECRALRGDSGVKRIQPLPLLLSRKQSLARRGGSAVNEQVVDGRDELPGRPLRRGSPVGRVDRLVG
jgi:hypothetical protein